MEIKTLTGGDNALIGIGHPKEGYIRRLPTPGERITRSFSRTTLCL